MHLRINWLRVVCVGALAVGVGMMPITASAQSRKHVSTKSHKVSHRKKTRIHHVKHARKAKLNEAVILSPARVIEPVSPPVQAIPTGPVAGTPYDETAWRGFHSDWNGEYHFNGGKYYYDTEFKYPAVIPNEFSAIAARFGGPSILDNDPTLVFSGDSGEPYPILQYNADRYNSDKKLKLKSAYFGRAYFWRDGARYDRKLVVDDKGARCFQFVKHP